MANKLMLVVFALGASCNIPFTGWPAPTGTSCTDDLDCTAHRGLNTCDSSFPGGYCTRACTGLPGTVCPGSGNKNDGVCGLPLGDGSLGCAARCEVDGGSVFGACRSGYRCVPSSEDGGACAAPAECPLGMCLP